jgi:hypothetical protein
MSGEFPRSAASPQKRTEEEIAGSRAELAAPEAGGAPLDALATSEVPVETIQRRAVGAAPDPALAERESNDAAALHATRERLGVPTRERAELIEVTAGEDPLAGLTPEDYKSKFRFLKRGVDFPQNLALPANEVVKGKTVGEWLTMLKTHYDESDRISNALYEKAINGTITPDQKQILADYLIDQHVIQNGLEPANGRSDSVFGPRWKELWDSPAFADVIAIAKEASRRSDRTPL